MNEAFTARVSILQQIELFRREAYFIRTPADAPSGHVDFNAGAARPEYDSRLPLQRTDSA
jgi:hypothetical protein